MTNPVPPIEDADRVQTYETGMTTVTTVDLDYPLFGDARDIKVFVDDEPLVSGWVLSSISGTAISLVEQPIADGRITFSPAIGAGKTLEIRYVRQPRRETQPTSGGIGRREFNLIISDLVAAQREQRRDLDNIPVANDGAAGADGADGWSPVFAAETDGSRSVLKVVDWTGGTGTKPDTGVYVGATGFVVDIADGVNVRGASGAGTGDMLASTYDSNGDGKVNSAVAADSVPWSGVSSKPTFATVATSGDYTDLASLPTLGTAAAADTGTGVGDVPVLDSNSRLSDGSGDLRDIPQNAKTSAYVLVVGDAGKHISITTGGITVNSGVHGIGDAISIYNNSGSSQTITQGSGVTLRLAGTATTGNRTLGQRGICTILCVASNEFVISGAGLT